jgi:hypothetical protein
LNKGVVLNKMKGVGIGVTVDREQQKTLGLVRGVGVLVGQLIWASLGLCMYPGGKLASGPRAVHLGYV